jgi:hypothetical protein
VQKSANIGGTVWILGIKTERGSDAAHVAGVIDTEAGGRTELLGGLIYPVIPQVPVNQAAFVVKDSHASFIYAVSVHNPISTDPTVPDGDFKTQVEEVRLNVVIAASKQPSGKGRCSATASMAGVRCAGRWARITADGSTAVTSNSADSYDPVPAPTLSTRCAPAMA